jgi:hypothetical protein
MPPDPEQATERTKLLYHVANDRRLSAVLQEDEAQSIIGSYVSKDEQALASAPVGERLPYNDYTTIDWLHDLVKFLDAVAVYCLILRRSKTPIVSVRFMLGKASNIASFLPSIPAQAGSPLHLLAFSLPALPSS